MLKLVISAIIGVALGVIGSRFLFVGSALSLIPWGIAGLLIGYWSGGRWALINGAVYGFVLAFIFMVSGYSGSEPLITRFPFFALLGVVGAVCGFVLGLLGSLARKLVTGRPQHP